MKKILSLLLAVLLVFSLCACAKNDAPKVIIPADSFARGSGTEADPYLISTAGELLHLQLAVNEQGKKDYLSAHFRLAKDIDLGGNPWRPIGLAENGHFAYFTGTFDGAGHTIKNFTTVFEQADGEFSNHLGLFSGVSGMICNLNVENYTLSGVANCNVGAIAAYLAEGGSLVNCSVGRKCTVSGDVAGGLVAICLGNLENCSNAAPVTGLRAAGGVVAYWSQTGGMENEPIFNLAMANCSNAGAVTGGRTVGGVVASLGCGLPGEITMNNCSNAGSITLDRVLDFEKADVIPVVGGLVGRLSNSDKRTQIGLLACSNAGSVNAKNCGGDSYAGGLLGWGNVRGELTLLSCANAGEVEGGLTAGGLMGAADVLNYDGAILPDERPTVIISACSNAGEVSGAVVGGLLGALCLSGDAMQATFENCVNSADVRVNSGIPGCGGGLIGGMTNAIPARLAYCTCDGDVSAQEADNFQGRPGHLGGLIGLVLEKEPIIEGCSFTGSLESHEEEHYLTSETYIFDP